MKKIILLVILISILFFLWVSVGGLPKNIQKVPESAVKVVTEESVVIDTVKKVGPSVVTVSQDIPQTFSIFGLPDSDPSQPAEPQNIGSGFIVTLDGLIVTNKHVVSSAEGKYQVITSNDKKYDVEKIYRDPLSDVAIIKIDPAQNAGQKLTPVELGDSSKLQVGQFVIAIGTALGEFKNTVTTGVISGLSRGITENIQNVIQTDAAINPGNSGGPLLNSSGQVIGVNTAIAVSGQNIGFALPINVIRDSLKNFNETGQFNRPYLGVAYKMISRDLAILNSLPEGAYVQTVVENSAASRAGVKVGDIITKIDGEKIQARKELSSIISKKKVGDTITLTIWREDNGNGETFDLKALLDVAPSQ